ncbi:MAG: hypothetical protein Q8M54_01470 [Desulfobaccales bacterium]|nr:hypothetical protein [Desulfobaccales bacterium]
MALAMAVAASKVKILQEKAAASLPEKASLGEAAETEPGKAASPAPGGT